MRILAQYTVYAGKVWKLHVFEVENGRIVHYPVVEELAAARYINGIAIICHQDSGNLKKLQSMPYGSEDLNAYAGKLAELLANCSCDSPVEIYAMEYPLFRAVKLV